MNIHSLIIPLNTSSEQVFRLQHLQQVFAEICNVLAPVVRETKCWNRVALHHMMYRPLREQFPKVGSQMVCNAIYSVSRTSRMVYQSSQSPFNLQRLADKGLPLLRFLPSAPVYFDRHTLSIKKGSLSMYTLDGRMRFDLNLSDEDLLRFKTWKLHEVILSAQGEQFTLNFSFVHGKSPVAAEALEEGMALVSLPEYVLIDEDDANNSKIHSKGLQASLSGPTIEPVHLHPTQPISTVPQDRHLQLRLSLEAKESVSVAPAHSGASDGNSPLSLQLNISTHLKNIAHTKLNRSVVSAADSKESPSQMKNSKLTGVNS